jgi:hypothetical protein
MGDNKGMDAVENEHGTLVGTSWCLQATPVKSV